MSICSNVEGYTTPGFVLDSNLDSLIVSISYVNEISNKVNVLAHIRWSDVFEQLKYLEDVSTNKDDESIENESVEACIDNVRMHECEDEDDASVESDYDYNVFVDVGCEARESNECEPLTKQVLHALSKENVFFTDFYTI